MDEAQIATLVRLKAISKILDVPLEQFTTGSIPCDLLTTEELFRLWSCLKTNKGRQQALDALRRVVNEQTS